MPWYDAAWLYRVKITVLNTKVDADLTGFPVYLNLANLPAGFHANVNQTDGRDIRITTSDGVTEVPVEVVFYDAATDTGEVHFKGNLLSASDVDFYVYYGNAAATMPAAGATYGKNNVWDSSYKMVLHFSEQPDNSAGQIKDSTANGINGQTVNMEAGDRVASTVGHGLTFDGVNEYITFGDVLDMGTLDATIEVVFTGSSNRQQSIVAKTRFATNFARWFLYMESDGIPILGLETVGTGTVATPSSTAIGTGVNVLVGRYDRDGNLTLRRNKTQTLSVSIAAGNGENMQNADSVFVGAYPSTTGGAPPQGYYFAGTISELRIAATLRTPEWADAVYENLNSPATFYSVGTAESGGRAPTRLNNYQFVKVAGSGTGVSERIR